MPPVAAIAAVGASVAGAVISKDEAKEREEKAAERQEDIVRQERETATARKDEIIERQEATASRLRSELEALAQPDVLESERQERLRLLEPRVQELLEGVAFGDEGAVGVGPLGRSIEERLLGDIEQPREIPFEETFNPAFELLRDQVRTDAARRGLTGSGLELENLGRAGIDLAVRQAQERQKNRELNEQLRQQSIFNALTGGATLENIAQSRRSNIQNFLRDLQALEQSRRQNAQDIGQRSALGSAEIEQTGTLQGIAQQEGAAQRTFTLESQEALVARQAAQEDVRGSREALERTLGELPSLIGQMVLAGLSGGASLPFSAATNAGTFGVTPGVGSTGPIPIPTLSSQQTIPGIGTLPLGLATQGGIQGERQAVRVSKSQRNRTLF